MTKQSFLRICVACLAISAGGAAFGQSGFYGGVSLRDNGADSVGLTLGKQPLAWSRFATPAAEESTQRALVFGGYRWRNDVAVEAAFNSSDKYALRPGARGLGLGAGLSDSASRSWNADVYTSWEFIRSLSLYGRLGYAQSDQRALFSGASLVPGDPRRVHEGINYGLGLRYDVTHSLGLRVEYARFGRFTGETLGGLPEADQVSIGVQFRF